MDEAITEADAASALVDGLAQPDALRAWQQYRQFEWDAAVETANAALEMDENNALAYRVRGAVAHWRGQYDDALADLNHALELEPNDVEALALRTVLHYALSNSDAGDADAARAIEIAPHSVAALWAQGAMLLQNYEIEAAYVPFTQAIALDNQRPELYEWRAGTYLYSFQNEERAADYESALTLYPDFSYSMISQLWMQLNFGDNSQHEEVVARLLELYPDLDGTYHAAAYYYLHENDLEKAMTYAEQAIAANPASPTNYRMRGLIWMEMSEYEKALADYEYALSISPDSSRTLLSLSELAAEQDDMETAVSYAEQAFALNSEPDVKLELANTYAQAGDLEKAWKMAHEVLAVDPDNPDALLVRSLLWMEAGDGTEALNDLTVLLNNYPNNAFGHLLRAQLRLDRYEFEEAREDANRALELDPYYMDNAYYLLGMAALFENEDMETAISHIEDYITAGKSSGLKYGILAELYTESGRYEDAIDAATSGLALEDDAIDQLRVERAAAYTLMQEEDAARADIEEVIATSTDIDILVQAENLLDYISTLPELVNGRHEFSTDDYTLTYSPNWLQNTADDELFSLTLVQGYGDETTNFLAGVIDVGPGLTTQNIADAIVEGFTSMDGFRTLSLESAVIGGYNGLVRYYRLEDVNADGDIVVNLGRQYYLVAGNRAVLLIMQTTADNYDDASVEWDAIVESFELLP